jgi:site-specific DNA-adenine methylase
MNNTQFTTERNKKLHALTEKDKEYWSFKGNSYRGYGHGFFQYPAMMVPQVTQAIIDNIIEVYPNISTIYDPFVGSGTVMTESMLRGLSFFGNDINPLAILLCQVKSGPFFMYKLFDKLIALKDRIKNDKKTNYGVDFTNKAKWFTKSAIISLSKIRRSIRAEKDVWARRFFWIVLAETIRLTSNSRTSTFKLHTRTEEDIRDRRKNIDILEVFNNILKHNFFEFTHLYNKLNDNKLLNNGYYIRDIQIEFMDVRKIEHHSKAGIILTSPPYGDNVTTVPYGQHSFLPLQWIDFSDIDSKIDKSILLKTTNAIDYKSLGGPQKISKEEKKQIVQKSGNLNKFVNYLKIKKKDKINKVIAFFRDLDLCIDPILQSLDNEGIMVWVLGNRRVGGKQIPLDKILTDFFIKRDVSVFCELTRKIPSKRMPLKNNISDTMSDEIILLMCKDS